MTKQTNGNGESKIRKVIFNEATLVIALVSLVSGFIFWISNPQTEMVIRITKLESQIEHNKTVVESLEKIKNNAPSLNTAQEFSLFMANTSGNYTKTEFNDYQTVS